MNRMDDKYIAENDVIKRYLKDKLTAEETTEFEEYILDKPELLEQLELDAVLVENYSIALDEVNKEDAEYADMSFMSTIQRLLNKPRIHTIASIVNKPLVHSIASFAVGVMVVLLINANNVDSTLYSGTIDLVEVSPLRSSSAQDVADATYSLSNNADHIILLLQPGVAESESELITIIRLSDNAEVFKQQVHLNTSGDFTVGLDTSWLTPGMYEVTFGNQDSRSLSIRLLQ